MLTAVMEKGKIQRKQIGKADSEADLKAISNDGLAFYVRRLLDQAIFSVIFSFMYLVGIVEDGAYSIIALVSEVVAILNE